MEKVDVSVGALVEMITRGELRLPEMQRRYVWRAPRVRDLFDSLYRGYPSGAILVWESDDTPPARDLAVEQSKAAFASTKLLLDGQQRLTSLNAVLSGKPVHVRGRRKPIEILFNLDHPATLEEVVEVEGDEEDDSDDDDSLIEDDESMSLQEELRKRTFVVASKSLESLPNWVSVTGVMASSDAAILKRAGVTTLDDPRYQKYSDRLQRLRNIRQYMYVMHLLDRNLSYEEVAEIFVRVNSLGVKLRSSDLALAQITARWRKLLPLLEDFQKECEEDQFTLDLGFLVRAMVVFATGQCRFKSVSNIKLPDLEQGWRKAKDGLRFAINFLRANAKVDDETLLTSPFFLLAIGYFYQNSNESLSTTEERALLEWTLYGSGRSYFSGSAETRLDADLARIRSGGGVQTLLANLEQQFGRLRFNEGDIAGRSWVSGLYSLVFLALRRRGAKDWRTGLEISLNHRGRQHTIQAHHIFPKAFLRSRYDRKEINEIANLAFIGGTTNRRISATPPAEYLPKVVAERGEAALVGQCVPSDSSLWTLDRYPQFLEKRRRDLVQAVNELLDNL